MKRKILLSVAMAMIYFIASAQVLHYKDGGNLALFQKEIDEKTSFRTDEQVVRICAYYHVLDRLLPQLRQYVGMREHQCVAQEYMFPDSLKRRMLNKLAIEEIYQDSIDMLLIPFNRDRISGENISYALYMSEMIGLEREQYDFLMKKALDMARRIRKNRMLNVWDEEMDILKDILSKEQLKRMFYKKNHAIVNKLLQDGWMRLQEKGLTEQLDSATELKQARFYYNESEKIKAIYRYKPSIRKKCLNEIGKRKPTMIKMLDALDKEARLAKKEEETGVTQEFIW